MTIWCVEDDESIQEIEVYTLKSVGYDAKGFFTGRSFFSSLKISIPDLIILDVMLPDMDGLEILKKIRQSSISKDIPVIMATAKGSELDKIQTFDLGADDYLVKPFGMMEMVSRVKAVLRRCNTNEKKIVYRIETLVLNIEERKCTVDGADINLTYKEFEILKLFMSHVGTVVTREQLFVCVWNDAFISSSRTLDMHIKSLRKKLGKYGKYIKTVRNVGYRMEASD